jgi:hypothetical protein
MLQVSKVRLHSISADTIQPPDLKTPNLPPSQTSPKNYPKTAVPQMGKFTQSWYGRKWVICLEETTELACKRGEFFWGILFIS